MFDFFRDMTLELMGKDSDEEEKKRKEKKEQERRERIIFSKGVKRLIYVFGILYIFMGGFSLVASIQYAKVTDSAAYGALQTVKFIFLSGVDIAAMICLTKGKKKTEIAGAILVIVFVVCMYLATMLQVMFL